MKERTSTVRLASDLARVEVHRSTLRREPAALTRAVAALSGVHLIPMGERVVTEALAIGDAVLRSLDAIHLASASVVKPRLTAFVAYDKRPFSTAEAEGMPAVAPGT